MSTRRLPQTPPDLPGFTYVELLGSGGFADVFLYEQQLPRRRVAVKVLLTDRMGGDAVDEFTAEANAMALLSTHPAIVTIYQAAVADDGRPYLVMEYCPKPNLRVRYRHEPFSVAESLRVGIQVAGAVETAHRAGILHRDIKPANILVTEYNRPALTDFGIASPTVTSVESSGLSVPWSPPESFADVPHGDVRSDVYALGATVYTLLAGRSPFELPGERNGAADLIGRIETMPVPPLGRADVPPTLEDALRRAMAKDAADRPASALAFARALQKAQIELALGVTPVDILDDGVVEEADDEEDGLTRVRGVVSIDPQTAPAAGPTRKATAAPPPVPVPEATVRRGAPAPAPAPSAEQTVRRGTLPPRATTDAAPAAPAAPSASARPAAPPVAPAFASADAAVDIGTQPSVRLDTTVPRPRRRRRTGLWIGLAAGVVVLAGIVVGASILNGLPGNAAAETTPTRTAQPQDALPVTVTPPTHITGVVHGGEVVWTWRPGAKADGDAYLWQDISRPDKPGPLQRADEATATQKKNPAGATCISLQAVRASGQSSPAVSKCVS